MRDVLRYQTLRNNVHQNDQRVDKSRIQPTREVVIGNDFRDADVHIIEGYQCRLWNGGRFGKLVWSEVDHEFR